MVEVQGPICLLPSSIHFPNKMTKELPPHSFIRPLGEADLDQCVRVETAGFPLEERASPEKVKTI